MRVSIVEMISLCEISSSSELGRYFSTHGRFGLTLAIAFGPWRGRSGDRVERDGDGDSENGSNPLTARVLEGGERQPQLDDLRDRATVSGSRGDIRVKGWMAAGSVPW